jgi:hypothetical protein
LDDWDYGDLVFALTAALAVATALLAALLWRGTRYRRDPVSEAYQGFCTKLAAIGLARADSEPPIAYARRVIKARADLTAAVHAITQLYTELRYNRTTRSADELRRQVAQFRPPKAWR